MHSRWASVRAFIAERRAAWRKFPSPTLSASPRSSDQVVPSMSDQTVPQRSKKSQVTEPVLTDVFLSLYRFSRTGRRRSTW